MKKLVLSFVFMLAVFSSAWSQDCSRFYPFSEGTKAEITNYGKKNKVVATTEYIVTAVTSNGGIETAAIHTKVHDAKGKLIVESDYDITCQSNRISIDMNSMMSPDLFQQFQDAKVEVSGTNIDLPNDLSAGMTLPNAEMNASIDLSGIKMKLDVMMTDRKVEGTESVTTPAGTFDCYVITYTSYVKMGFKRTGSAKQWLAEGVGLVKQEDYNKKGKVTSSSLLTSLTR